MKQTEALELFDKKVSDEIFNIMVSMRDFIDKGNASMIYYPPTESLLYAVASKLKEEGYWVKLVRDKAWSRYDLKTVEAKKELYVYIAEVDRYGEKFYRRGVLIWWKKPSWFDRWIA